MNTAAPDMPSSPTPDHTPSSDTTIEMRRGRSESTPYAYPGAGFLDTIATSTLVSTEPKVRVKVPVFTKPLVEGAPKVSYGVQPLEHEDSFEEHDVQGHSRAGTVDSNVDVVTASDGGNLEVPVNGDTLSTSAGSLDVAVDSVHGSLDIPIESETPSTSAAFQPFLDDIVSSVSSSNHNLYNSIHLTSASTFDIGSILGKLEDLMVRHTIAYTQTSSTLSPQTQLAMFLTQLTAIANNPFFMPLERRKAVEGDLEPSIANWLKDMFAAPEDTKVLFHKAGGNMVLDERILHTCLLKTFSTPHPSAATSTSAPIPTIYYPDSFTSSLIESDLQRAWTTVGLAMGLPSARMRSVQCLEGGEGMDLKVLEEIVQRDLGEGCQPVLVLGRVGTPVTGQSDDPAGLRAICDKYDMWLHLEGPSLSLLMLPQQTLPTSVAGAKLADSVTVDLGGWFNIDGLPIVSLIITPTPPVLSIHHPHPTVRPHHTYVASTNNKNHTASRLSIQVKNTIGGGCTEESEAPLERTLHLWAAMQVLGVEGLRGVVEGGLKKVREFISLLAKDPQLEVLESGEETLMALVRSKPVGAGAGTASSQDGPDPFREGLWAEKGTKYIFSRIPEETRSALNLELVCVTGTWWIRYDPLHSGKFSPGLLSPFSTIPDSHFPNSSLRFAATPLSTHTPLLTHLTQQIIMDAKRVQSCFDLEDSMTRLVEERKELFWFRDGDVVGAEGGEGAEEGEEDVWCGVGAVRYVPHYIDTAAGTISAQVLEDLDRLNKRIAEELAKEVGEGVFEGCTVGWFEPLVWGNVGVGEAEGVASRLLGGDVVETPPAVEEEKRLGEGQVEGAKDGEWRRAVCVRIGMHEKPYTPDLLKEMIDLVVKKGHVLEKDEQFVASIKAVIRKGIEEAERQLRTESTDDYAHQPSLLRALPLVGSVLSWWRPLDTTAPKLPTAKSFDIATGFRAVPLGGPGTPRASVSLRRGSLSGSLGGME
ncbi:hypothetical protein HK097_004544, partial [Rhizophlyctis rosea]